MKQIRATKKLRSYLGFARNKLKEQITLRCKAKKQTIWTWADPTKVRQSPTGTSKIEQSKNFLDTFGYLDVELPKALNYSELSKDYWQLVERYTQKSKDDLVKSKESYAIPGFCFHSEIASKLLVEDLDSTISRLLGPNYIILGSDASLFFGRGSPWHRDTSQKLPIFKLNVYLDFDNKGLGGEFLVIPGSQHVSDTFSSLLQKSLAWPDLAADMGGVAERRFFPEGSNPTEWGYQSTADWLPLKSLPIATGGAILFNTNLVHAVTSKISPSDPRKLITYLFCPNPVDLSENNYCRQVNGAILSNDELLDEIYHMKAMTYLRTNICSYGEAINRYPIYLCKHGLDFDKVLSKAKFLEMSGSHFTKETGKHSDVQIKTMGSFLTANFKVIEN